MNRWTILRKVSNKHSKKISELLNIIESTDRIEKKYFVEKNIKDRMVIDKEDFDSNDILVLEYYQYLLREEFDIKFPNRDMIINELLDIMPYLFKYKKVTVFKFDFKDFFRSIDISKILKLLKESTLSFKEYEFIYSTYTELINVSPGLGINNILIEILGREFDEKVESLYHQNLIYYERYVDDGILILDSSITEDSIKSSLRNVMKEVFGEKTTFNEDKVCFISLPSKSDFTKVINFLGYSFSYDYKAPSPRNKKDKKSFTFGIATSKLEKEMEKIHRIIDEYQSTHKQELLENRLDIYFKRVTFYDQNDRCWKSIGFSRNYEQIKKMIEFDKEFSKYKFSPYLNQETEKFLELKFLEKQFSNLPNQLVGQIKNQKFISNLFHNKAVILNPKIGLNYAKLSEYLRSCDIRISQRDSYQELQRRFIGRLTEKNR